MDKAKGASLLIQALLYPVFLCSVHFLFINIQYLYQEL